MAERFHPLEGDPSSPSNIGQEGKIERHSPHLPAWFERSQAENYGQVLDEELNRIITNPAEYFAGQHFLLEEEKGEKGKELTWGEVQEQYQLDDEQVKQLATTAKEKVAKDFSFSAISANAEGLLQALPEQASNVKHDVEVIAETMMRRVHTAVLRRMITEYLPRRQVILHRGSTKPVREDLKKVLPESAVAKLKDLGPFGLLMKFLLKDPSFRVEEIQKNLERGIGGFEFDVRANAQGEPVVTHSSSPKALEQAPHLRDILALVREVLPDDPKAKRQARRGLRLFLHMKVNETQRGTIEKMIDALDRFHLTQSTSVQTGRPEVLSAIDDIERQRTTQDPKRRNTKFVFQSFPISEAEGMVRQLGPALKKMGAADRYQDSELRSITKLADEMPIVTEFPPKGKVLELLQRHDGVLAVSASMYKKDLLAKAQSVNLGIHIGAFEKGEEVDQMLGPDKEGRRPETMMGMSEEVIFPEKKDAEHPERKGGD